MMTKVLSLVLSFTILFTTVAPSYAQARNATRTAPRLSASELSGVQDETSLQRVNPELQIRKRVAEAQYEQLQKENEIRMVNERLLPIVDALTLTRPSDGQQGGGEGEPASPKASSRKYDSDLIHHDEYNLLDYDEYEKQYLEELAVLERQLLREAKSAEEQRVIKQEMAARRTDLAVAQGYGEAEYRYRKYLEEHPKEVEAAFKKAMVPYVNLAYEYYKKSSVASEMLFLAQAYGLLSPGRRQLAADFFRRGVKNYQDSCGSLSFWTSEESANAEQRKCEQALKMIPFVAAFGEQGDNSQDAEVLKEFLLANYRGIAAPAVIQAVVSGLLALKAEGKLENALMIIRREVPYSPIDVSLSVFSIEAWVNVFQDLANSENGFGTAQFAEGFEYSYYPTPEENGVKYENKSNIWLDVGEYLAELAQDPKEERRTQVRNLLNTVMGDFIGYDAQGKLQVAFRPFVVGALAGGYEVTLSGPGIKPQPVLQRDGSTYVAPSTNTQGWERLSQAIKDLGWTHNQYISWYLYNLRKIDLDPETARYINNVLTHAFVSSAKRAGHPIQGESDGYSATRYQIGIDAETHKAVYMDTRKHPTNKDLAEYRNRQSWKQVGFSLDIALVIITVVFLSAAVVKSGVSLLRTGTRVLRLARAGKMISGGGMRINTLRVLSRARAMKGVPILRDAASATVRDIVGLERLKIEPVMKEIRAARAVKVTKPVVKMDLRVLDGKQYMVPEGTETFYVRGQVHFAPKGTKPAELAKQFGVEVREVKLAKNGSVAPTSSVAPRNYSMGDGVNGARGSQPVVGRPGEPVTINPREVAVKPEVPASLVKQGEKAALVFQNGEWNAFSVPEELTKAEIASNFKVSVDDVDYVVKFADGSFAPEWGEYSLVWDVLKSPAPASKPFELTSGKLFKARASAWWETTKENLGLTARFAWKHPFRAAGAAGSSWGVGGVAPAAVYAEAPAAASIMTDFEIGASLFTPARATEAFGAVGSAARTSAETLATTTRTATQLGHGWSNPFWGEGLHVTDWRFLTPVGALPSAELGHRIQSKWATQETYNNYRTQLNKWLFASSALQRQHNPWFLRDAWKDFSTYISLSYQEWRMLRAGNLDYRDYLLSMADTQAAPRNDVAAASRLTKNGATASADTQAAETNEAAAPADPGESAPLDAGRQDKETVSTTTESSSSSGILYSGIPVMALGDLLTKAYKGIVRILSNRADTYAQDVLNRKIPLLTELRDIVEGNASRKWKEQALLRLHKEFNVFSAVIGNLSVESRNKFNALKQDDTQVAKFLYNLYSTGQLDNVLNNLNNHIPVEELSKQLEAITSTSDFDAARRKVYDETDRLPFDANDWQGYVETVQNVDKGLIEGLFRPAGWAAQSAADGKEVSGAKVYYENDIPVYYRNSKGELSAHPVIILHQEVLSSKIAEAYAALLSELGLSTKKGISIPKGMILALDENGRFKYVLQPGHRAELLSSKSGKKMNEDIYANGSSPVDLTTPYSTTDLLVVAKLLEAGVAADFQLTLEAPNSFKPFVNLLGALSGLGADTVMVGPFKEAAGPENPAVPNAFGGTGYVTPRVAAATVPDMQKWGVARSVMLLLSVTLVTLLVSVGIGINGLIPKEEFSLPTLAVPLVVLITAGSLLRSVIPLILKAYKDPRQYTAANLDVSTWQQGSKLSMFGLTAAWYGRGGKFVAVPIAAVLVLATLGLFLNTPQGRRVISETITAFKDHPKESFKDMGKGSLILAKDLLKGFVKGISAPVIWGGKKVKAGFKWTANKLKSSRKTTAPSAGGAGSEAGVKEKTASPQTDEERYRDEYENFFKKLPEVKAALSRVSLAYASYAASVMMVNQLAESDIILALFGGIGRYITFAFSLASFLVRFFASKWVKSGKFTDDQLTGISFAGLALTALGLAGAPFTGGIGLVVVVLLGVMLNASTAVPGQLDQARLQNLVSAMVQSQKNKVLQDESLSPAEREAQIADLEAKESKWSGWAKADYDNANANGIWGVYAATGASVALPYLGIYDWSWIARTVFAYAGIVAGLGALKTGSQSLDFIKALFSRNHTLVVTAEDIADGKVNADTFGVTDENKANKVVPSLLKGKDSLKTLQEQLMPYGVEAISSEVKLTKVLKRLIEIHNRFVASAEKLGDEALHDSFKQVLAVATAFESVLKISNVSESLRREFEKLLAALCVNGSLDQGVLSHPAYMEEGSFAMPSNYRNLLEARDIIKELKQLAANIDQGGAAVNANTYSQFVQYHAEAKRLLQTYAAENPSESLIVRVEEERIRLVCLGLKNANALRKVLRANAGQTPEKDIKNLEDILSVYEGDMQISSEWVLLFQSKTKDKDIESFFNAHPGLDELVAEMMHRVDAETLKGSDEIIQGTGNAAALKISSQSELQALFIAPLEQALQLKQQGLPVDEDTQSEIADLYQRADQAMTQYLNAHPKEGAAVIAMHAQLDKLYTQIIGEAPTKEKVAELAKKSSGLMSMVDWFGQLWEDLLAWFKDGDDSPGANDGSGDLSSLPSPGGGTIQLARLPGKKEVDAVIFDMDGTLLNTLGAWKNSTSNFLRSRGIEPPENIDAEMAALSLLEGARVLKERYGFKESPEELLEEVLATVRKFYEEDAMPKPGVPGVLQALKKQGIKICVATASDREFAEAAFKRTGLMEYIDFIITCDEVGVGKQNPLIYETALKKLGTDRKRTLVVEDALHALQTAKKAGFPTAGVYEVNFAADQSALQSDATYYVPSFQTVAVGN